MSHRGVCGQTGTILRPSQKYPEPMTDTAIKGFIGLLGHCRCFIKDFAKIVDPLHEYEAARDAFHKLKKVVMSAPVLTYADPNKEYLLKTDASKLGLDLSIGSPLQGPQG